MTATILVCMFVQAFFMAGILTYVSRLREFSHRLAEDVEYDAERIAELSTENAELKGKVEVLSSQVANLLGRVTVTERRLEDCGEIFVQIQTIIDKLVPGELPYVSPEMDDAKYAQEDRENVASRILNRTRGFSVPSGDQKGLENLMAVFGAAFQATDEASGAIERSRG